jgi:hypothetical protein
VHVPIYTFIFHFITNFLYLFIIRNRCCTIIQRAWKKSEHFGLFYKSVKNILKNDIYKTHARQILATRCRAAHIIKEVLNSSKNKMRSVMRSFYRYV